jgi:hypothetical protein
MVEETALPTLSRTEYEIGVAGPEKVGSGSKTTPPPAMIVYVPSPATVRVDSEQLGAVSFALQSQSVDGTKL